MENIIFYSVLVLCLVELFIIGYNYRKINKLKKFAKTAITKKDETITKLATSNKQIEEQEKTIKTHRTQIVEIQEKNEHLRSEYNLLDKTNNDQIVQIQNNERTITQLNAAIVQQQEKIDELQQSLETSREIRDKQSITIKKQIAEIEIQKQTIDSLLSKHDEMTRELAFQYEKIEKLEKERESKTTKKKRNKYPRLSRIGQKRPITKLILYICTLKR